jgi:hypothetical protein
LNVFLIPDIRGKGYLHFKGIDMKLSNIASTVIATLALVAGAAHAEDPARRFPLMAVPYILKVNWLMRLVQ